MGTIGGGRYELGEQIATGAIGVVLRALDTVTGEAVAVKRLRAETAAHPESVVAFLAEAEILAQLRHPAIVRLRELLAESDGYALVLDLVPGADLRRRVRADGPLPPALAVEIAATVAEALGYLHGKGFLHGDIKPGNVVLPDDGMAVRLVDFGVSRRVGQADRTTYATPEYVAPEVVLGQIPGTAADVYALGMVLYELSCGRSAFRGGTSDEVINRHLTCVPVPPPELPESIWPVISACLSMHPGHRPTAHALRAQLRDLLPGLSSLPAPAPLAADAVTWWPREADETAPILGLRRVAWVPATRQNPEAPAPERMVAIPMPDNAPGTAADGPAEPPAPVAPPVPLWPAPLSDVVPPPSTSPPSTSPPFTSQPTFASPPTSAPGFSPVSGPPTSGTPYGATSYGTPTSGPPNYGAPISGPPGYPVPGSGPGGYGAPAQGARGPEMAPGRAAVPGPPIWEVEPGPAGESKSRVPLLLGVGAAILVLIGLLALGGYALRGQFTGDKPAANPSPSATVSPSAGPTTAQPGPTTSGNAKPSPAPTSSTSPATAGTGTAGPQPTGSASFPVVPSIGAPLPTFP